MKSYKLANKSYSRRHGTYSAVWLNHDGSAAFWGSYSPDDGSYYLAVPGKTLAQGMWIKSRDGDYEFKYCGTYSFNDVRCALQLGTI